MKIQQVYHSVVHKVKCCAYDVTKRSVVSKKVYLRVRFVEKEVSLINIAQTSNVFPRVN